MSFKIFQRQSNKNHLQPVQVMDEAPGQYKNFFRNKLVMLGFVGIFALIGVFTLILSHADSPNDTLVSGQSLTATQTLDSVNGSMYLQIQSNGNLALLTAQNKAVWTSGTITNSSAGEYVKLTDEGNLALFAKNNQIIWQTHTTTKGARVQLLANGNLVMYDKAGKTLWQTNTAGQAPVVAATGNSPDSLPTGHKLLAGQKLYSSNQNMYLEVQADGNVVLSTAANKHIWQTGTSGASNYMVVQGDGDLAVYNAAGAQVWHSNTKAQGTTNYLVVQTDGNLVLYSASHQLIWQSNTAGQASKTKSTTVIEPTTNRGTSDTTPVVMNATATCNSRTKAVLTISISGGTASTAVTSNKPPSYAVKITDDNNTVFKATQTAANTTTTTASYTSDVSNDAAAGTTFLISAVAQTPLSGDATADVQLVSCDGSNTTMAQQDAAAAALNTSRGTPIRSSVTDAPTNKLTVGQKLSVGQIIYSTNHNVYLSLQTTNLRLYTALGKLIWQTNTAGNDPGTYLTLEGSGDLVLYSGQHRQLWHSNTANANLAADRFVVQTDGNLVLYKSSQATWSSHTAGLQPQGNSNGAVALSTTAKCTSKTTASLILNVSGGIRGNDGQIKNARYALYVNNGTTEYKLQFSQGGPNNTGDQTYTADVNNLARTGASLSVSAQSIWPYTASSSVTAVLPNCSLTPTGSSTITRNLNSGVLYTGQRLGVQERLYSRNNEYYATITTKGNLVVFRRDGSKAVWSTGTNGSGSNNVLVMQSDGNLVMYSGSRAVWASYKFTTDSRRFLDMQTDGNLVVYSAPAKPIWATGVPPIRPSSAKPYMSNWWGGYVYNSSGITKATTDLVIPRVANCAARTSIAPQLDTTSHVAAWLGIDGWGSSTVEQIGITLGCRNNGDFTVGAWYQLYPQPAKGIPASIMPIQQGDLLHLSVVHNSGTSYTTSIVNAYRINPATKKPYSFSYTGNIAAANISAECVVEDLYSDTADGFQDSYLSMPNLSGQKIDFRNCYAYKGGTRYDIAATDPGHVSSNVYINGSQRTANYGLSPQIPRSPNFSVRVIPG